MADEQWQRIVIDDGRFEVFLPFGWELRQDTEQPPGQVYYSCQLPSRKGSFSVFRQPLPGQVPDDRLALERSLGNVVTDVQREHLVAGGQPAERLRYYVASHRQRTVEQDALSGERFYTTERDIAEIVTVLFWSGSRAAASAVSRIETDAPPDEERLLGQALDRLRLLRSL
jgi:hypothetical protein